MDEVRDLAITHACKNAHTHARTHTCSYAFSVCLFFQARSAYSCWIGRWVWWDTWLSHGNPEGSRSKERGEEISSVILEVLWNVYVLVFIDKMGWQCEENCWQDTLRGPYSYKHCLSSSVTLFCIFFLSIPCAHTCFLRFPQIDLQSILAHQGTKTDLSADASDRARYTAVNERREGKIHGIGWTFIVTFSSSNIEKQKSTLVDLGLLQVTVVHVYFTCQHEDRFNYMYIPFGGVSLKFCLFLLSVVTACSHRPLWWMLWD